MLKELIDNDVGRYMIEEGDDDDEEDKVME
jgi:hypothetical protein